ncbi:MAG: tripartite tricarboxylate transporter TctB family protein [Desulfobacteraceae bacterium]|nr:MAG: tripartite tricarboxylate transporter TctB family protein [Desulfobacteraceae bacterium]
MNAENVKKAAPYVVIFFACAYFYYLADQFRYAARPGHLGPEFWPKALLGMTMAVCLYEVIKTAFRRRAESISPSTHKKIETAKTKKKIYPALLILGVVMTVAYVSLVSLLGFALCTFLYFAAFMFVGRYRNTWAILGNSVIGTLVLLFIFMKIVYVSLPLGQGPFSTFSLFIMGLMGIK